MFRAWLTRLMVWGRERHETSITRPRRLSLRQPVGHALEHLDKLQPIAPLPPRGGRLSSGYPRINPVTASSSRGPHLRGLITQSASGACIPPELHGNVGAGSDLSLGIGHVLFRAAHVGP